jgi:urease accessory protein
VRTSEVAAHGAEVLPLLKIALTYEERQKSRLRLRLESGEEVAISRPRGSVLRGGDTVQTTSGTRVEIVSAPEKLLHIEADSLARVAYHLGNRHVPLQIMDGELRYLSDHVLDDMLERLGLTVEHGQMPFEPEAGAYHSHGH